MNRFQYCLSLSLLPCGCETWKTTSSIENKVQVLVNRCLRHILRIRWPVGQKLLAMQSCGILTTVNEWSYSSNVESGTGSVIPWSDLLETLSADINGDEYGFLLVAELYGSLQIYKFDIFVLCDFQMDRKHITMCLNDV